jgi:hypothetical protein
VSSPPVVPYGTIALLGNTIVIGPGQYAFASFLPFSGIFDTSGAISSRQDTCAISGLSDGRPFAA